MTTYRALLANEYSYGRLTCREIFDKYRKLIDTMMINLGCRLAYSVQDLCIKFITEPEAQRRADRSILVRLDEVDRAEAESQWRRIFQDDPLSVENAPTAERCVAVVVPLM